MPDPYRARHTDPETSHEWADWMNEKYSAQWRVIWADIRRHGPSTYREVAKRTGIEGTSTSTAMTKMEAAGLLRRLWDENGDLRKRDRAMLRDVHREAHGRQLELI